VNIHLAIEREFGSDITENLPKFEWPGYADRANILMSLASPRGIALLLRINVVPGRWDTFRFEISRAFSE